MRVAILLALVSLVACGREAPDTSGGDTENGRLLLRQFGCGSCHEIPGVATARGKVGPPLAGIGSRVYIAGVLPNTPDRLAAFIRSPQLAHPNTVMPDLGVSEEHARDMVAYLGTLQ